MWGNQKIQNHTVREENVSAPLLQQNSPPPPLEDK